MVYKDLKLNKKLTNFNLMNSLSIIQAKIIGEHFIISNNKIWQFTIDLLIMIHLEIF